MINKIFYFLSSIGQVIFLLTMVSKRSLSGNGNDKSSRRTKCIYAIPAYIKYGFIYLVFSYEIKLSVVTFFNKCDAEMLFSDCSSR